MNFGLTNETIKAIATVFSKYTNIEQVILYGSRAMGNYKNGSDIDLTIVSNNLNVDTLFKIELELDDLLLPYKIDLSLYHQISNANLLEHINRVGKIFYQKQSE